MSSELAIYKKNRITSLQNTFNSNIAKLNDELAKNIQKVQLSNLNTKVKQTQINNLKKQYDNIVNALKVNLNRNILSINNFFPKPVSINKNKKALLIGINYTGTKDELSGCINDVNNIKNRLITKGFNNIETMTDLTSKKPTRENILNGLTNLLVNSQAGDLLFFSYSGHGTYIIDKNNDENTGYDQCIYPIDTNIIVDDEIKNIILKNLKSNVTLCAIFDSCFSGSVLDLRYQYMDSLNYDKFTENEKESETLGNVFMISGCSDYQTSADAVINKTPTGAMTWSLLESLKQKPNCSWRELLQNMRSLLKTSNFDQIPQLSSGQITNIDDKVFI